VQAVLSVCTCLCAGCAEHDIVCVRIVKNFGCLHVGSSGCGTACMWAVLSVVLSVSGLSEWALSMCGLCFFRFVCKWAVLSVLCVG
jgi:hypothetical protein